MTPVHVDFDPLTWTRKEATDQLDELSRLDILRGWSIRSGKFVVGYWESQTDESFAPMEVVLSWPQLRAFLCGVDAGMEWTFRVAKRVKTEEEGADVNP